MEFGKWSQCRKTKLFTSCQIPAELGLLSNAGFLVFPREDPLGNRHSGCMNMILAPVIFLFLPEESFRWSCFIEAVADTSPERGTGSWSGCRAWLHELDSAQCRHPQSRVMMLLLTQMSWSLDLWIRYDTRAQSHWHLTLCEKKNHKN